MSSDLHTRFHETWLGMVQPVEGLVVSIPMLFDAQCMERHGPELQEKFRALCPLLDAETGVELENDESPAARRASGERALSRKERAEFDLRRGTANRRCRDLREFIADLLGWAPELCDHGDADDLEEDDESAEDAEPDDEGTNTAPRGQAMSGLPDIETPESLAGKPYVALVWELPNGLDFDKPEIQTGDWRYPPAAKFDRLLRACRVPIGVLCNGDAIRLIYAPYGEATGSVTFDLTDMGTVDEPTGDRDSSAHHAFDDEVIDRLFALNAQRAAEERVLGTIASDQTARGNPSRKGRTKAAAKQLSLKEDV